MTFIRTLARGRKLYENEHNIQIVIPAEQTKKVPFYCPVCESCMKTEDDERSFRLYECCDACEREYVHSDMKRWKEGWRPIDIVKRQPDLTVTVRDR